LLVRTAGDPMAMSNQVMAAVRSVDSDTAMTYVVSMEQARSDTLASPRVMTQLLGAFAVLALVITASGIGGMLALSVSQRVKEIGVRLALGAQPSDVLLMIIRQGMLLVLLGLAGGVGLAVVMIGFLQTFLFSTAPTDPLTMAGVSGLLALTALVACYIPARKATRIDPLVALHHE
ncbi:MAG TPA: FtsX-like permease family protein, partial [Alphaproteobacteria bacterium]|nr:FtsX-like permease family protein [Alphaproteobacteria bacterium]